MDKWNLWDMVETLGRLFIIVAVVYLFALVEMNKGILRIVMVVLTIWAFYPGGRFVYYSFKEAFKKKSPKN